MNADEIVLFRYRRGLRVGRVVESASGKVRLQVDRDKSVSVPTENVALRTGAVATSAGELARFAGRVEDLAATLDLGELWELVLGEADAYSFDDLAELNGCAPDEADARAALLWHLHSGECTYFEPVDAGYAVRSEGVVADERERRERQAKQAVEEQEFTEWFAGSGAATSPESFSERQRAWLDRLVDYAVRAEDSPHESWSRSLLADVRRGGDLRRYVFERLVHVRVFEPHEHLALRRLALPVGFPADAETEADAYRSSDEVTGDQRDLRELVVLTVDGEKTTDIDDALSVETVADGYRVGVHITDLSGAVPEGGALDRESRSRLTSLYFPEERIPMLPEVLAYSQGSLVAGEDRPVVSLLADIDRDGGVVRTEIVRAVVRSRARLAYVDVDAVLAAEGARDGPDGDGAGGGDAAAIGGAAAPFAAELRALDEVATRLRAARVAAGAVELGRPDVEIAIGEDGSVTVELEARETPANRLVGELMVLYNTEVAKLCAREGLPALYRTQMSDGLPEVTDPSCPHQRYRFFRAVGPARLSLEPGPHCLLGVEPYCQASSPLRRFLDLALQRQVVHWLTHGSPLYDAERLEQVACGIGDGVRERTGLEPDRRRYWMLVWMAGRLSESYEAAVLDVRDRDCLVELVGYGLRAPAAISSEVRPGDRVQVEVARIDPWDLDLRFREVAE